jgi:hypothetical protein|tara:strand:- start:1133 stop:1264 length:132 start_codon:yes stop_codon:yes gene_type:complete
MGAPWIIKKVPARPVVVEAPPKAPAKKVKVSKKKATAEKAATK